MPVIKFQCPQCQTPLRLENRALFLGRVVDCPECRQTLQIEAEGPTGIVARSVTQERSPPAELSANSRGALRPTSAIWDHVSRRPAWIGWSVAIFFVALLLWFARSPNHPSSSTTDRTPEPHEPTTLAKRADLPLVSPPKPPVLSDRIAQSPMPLPDVAQPADVEAPAIKNPQTLPELKPKPQAVADTLPKQPPLPEPPDEPESATPGRLTAGQIATRLNQPIARFDQNKPVAFVKLLDVLEDLIGVSVVWDVEQVNGEQLQKPVTMLLEQTTTGEILDNALKQVQLQRRLSDGRILLEPDDRAE